MASTEALAIALEVPGSGGPLRLAWDRGASDERGDPLASPWRIEGEIDWQAIEGLRMISAVFEDGQALALAALRPRGTTGHDQDRVAAHLEQSGRPVALTEALLSTEYDARGLPRRIGVELWAEPGSPPLRVAGDRRGEVQLSVDGARRELARMSFRLEGAGGSGTYELLQPA